MPPSDHEDHNMHEMVDDTDYTERLKRLWDLELRVLGEIDGYEHTEL